MMLISTESKPAVVPSKRETAFRLAMAAIGLQRPGMNLRQKPFHQTFPRTVIEEIASTTTKFRNFDRSQSTRPESRLTCGHAFTGTQPRFEPVLRAFNLLPDALMDHLGWTGRYRQKRIVLSLNVSKA
jgi:hypothetical protein